MRLIGLVCLVVAVAGCHPDAYHQKRYGVPYDEALHNAAKLCGMIVADKRKDWFDKCVNNNSATFTNSRDVMEMTLRAANDCLVRRFKAGENLYNRCIESRMAELIDERFDRLPGRYR